MYTKKELLSMFCSTVFDYNERYTDIIWDYPNITRPFSMIYYVVGGDAQYTIDNKTHTFEHNHLYIFPSNTKLSLYKKPEDKFYISFIHAALFPELTHVIDLDVKNDRFLSQIVSLIRQYIKKANTIYVRKLTELLVSYISEQSESTVSSLGYKIKSYIDENYLTVFTKNNLAEVFNYSNSHITRVFKETFNVTPSQYCTKLIAKRILNLIEENYSVSQIAIMLDFSSPENLSRFFKKHMGSSPSKYKKK